MSNAFEGSRSGPAGVSIGIAFFPYDGNTAEELLSKADAAMYLVKRGQAHGFNVVPGVGTAWKVGAPASLIGPD